MPPIGFTTPVRWGTFAGASDPPLSESVSCSSAPLLIPISSDIIRCSPAGIPVRRAINSRSTKTPAELGSWRDMVEIKSSDKHLQSATDRVWRNVVRGLCFWAGKPNRCFLPRRAQRQYSPRAKARTVQCWKPGQLDCSPRESGGGDRAPEPFTHLCRALHRRQCQSLVDECGDYLSGVATDCSKDVAHKGLTHPSR